MKLAILIAKGSYAAAACLAGIVGDLTRIASKVAALAGSGCLLAGLAVIAADHIPAAARLLHGVELGSPSHAKDWLVVALASMVAALLAALIGRVADGLEAAAQEGQHRMQHSVERHRA